jgi:hypothetical protein
VSIAYFTERLPDSPELRLAAAVVWLGTPVPRALRGGGGLLGWPRRLRHWLWLRLGPLGADVSVAGRPLFGGTVHGPRSVASFAPRHQPQPPIAYYDDGSRVLRVLGRVIRVPRDLTLVALVDATGSRATAPSLALRTVSAPTIAVSPREDLPEPSTATVAYMIGGDEPTWTAALRSDPVVRAFLDGQ